MFEGKYCSFLVVIVCEASVCVFSNIILIALLCRDLKALTETHLRSPRESRHSLYVIGYGLGKMLLRA